MEEGLELVRKFARSAEESGAHVVVVDDYSGAWAFLQGIVREARRVGLAKLGEDRLLEQIRGFLGDREVIVVKDVCTPVYVDALKEIDLGVCGVDFGIAETGTLVALSSSICEKLITITPKINVVLLSRNNIIGRFTEIVDKIYAALDNGYSVSLITGPSKTGDIELKLVKGVHGPNELYIIIVGGGVDEGYRGRG